MSSFLPISLFIGLKYYDLYNQIDINRKYTLYVMLFIFAVSVNITGVFILTNNNQKVLSNTQLWVYTIITWILFVSAAAVVELPFMTSIVTPFSNTIGYFMVQKKADVLISDMLSNYENTTDKEVKRILRQISSDNSLLLNSMTLTNARYVWTQFVGEDANNTETNNTLFDQLDNLLQYKYFIGKCVWYIYTGILVYFLLAYYNTKFTSSL